MYLTGPGSQSAFQFIPMVLNEVAVRALCRSVKFFHNKLGKPFLYGPLYWLCALEHCGIEKEKGLSQIVATMLETHYCLNYYCILNVDRVFHILLAR